MHCSSAHSSTLLYVQQKDAQCYAKHNYGYLLYICCSSTTAQYGLRLLGAFDVPIFTIFKLFKKLEPIQKKDNVLLLNLINFCFSDCFQVRDR